MEEESCRDTERNNPMSLLAWILGLAACDAVSHAADESEEARRAADDLRRRNEANERRIRRLEEELQAMKGGRQADDESREARRW